MTHWMDDDKTRVAFWVYAKDELGLTDDEVHEALKVDSVKKFAGDKDQARKLLVAFLGEKNAHELARLAGAVGALPEAPMVAWTKFISPSGFEWSFTMRAGLPDDLRTLAFDQMVGAVLDFEEQAEKADWLVPGALNGADARKKAAIPRPTTTQMEPPTGPLETSGDNGHDGWNETFLAESVTAQVSSNGRRYYSIKGGRCKKHGVTAWPEIAEPQLEKLTGYNPQQLEVGQEWPILAFSIKAVAEIPDGKEYPNKVTAFAPAQ